MDERIKRWTARRKSALVLDIIQGKTAVSELSRQCSLPPSGIESCVDQAKAGIENALTTKPEDIREQYETQLKALQEAYGEAMFGIACPKLIGRPVGEVGRDIILDTQQALKEDRLTVPMIKLCRWFEVPRRAVYHKPVKSTPKV